jgi:hypothetical protein
LTEVPLGTVTSWSSASDTAKYTGQETFSAIQNEWTTADRCSNLVSAPPRAKLKPPKLAIPRSDPRPPTIPSSGCLQVRVRRRLQLRQPHLLVHEPG